MDITDILITLVFATPIALFFSVILHGRTISKYHKLISEKEEAIDADSKAVILYRDELKIREDKLDIFEAKLDERERKIRLRENVVNSVVSDVTFKRQEELDTHGTCAQETNQTE